MVESLIELNQLRIILALGMLGYASYTDVTKREISDYVWIVFGALSVVLLFLEPQFWQALTNVGISLLTKMEQSLSQVPIANIHQTCVGKNKLHTWRPGKGKIFAIQGQVWVIGRISK